MKVSYYQSEESSIMLGSTLSSAYDVTVSNVGIPQAVIAVFTMGFVVRWLTKKKWNLPPGPSPLPLMGNILDLRGETLYMRTIEWKEKYGGVLTVYTGPSPMIVLCSIEALTEAYIDRSPDFANKPSITSLDVISHGGNNIAFAPYSEALKYRRRIAMLALRQYLTGSQHTERIHNLVTTTVDNMTREKGPFSPHSHLSYNVLNIIHDLCFGYHLSLDDQKFKDLLGFFDRSSGNVTGFWEDWFPILKYFPTKTYREAMLDVEGFQDYVRKQVAKRRSAFDGSNVESLVDNILSAQTEAEEGESETIKAGFTDLHVWQIIGDVFFAGIDSSRNTLDWIFLVLASKPEVQKKIHDEIDKVVGNAVPGREHRLGLIYTEAMILETMRMFPVVPMGLPHETLCDTQVLGYDVPAKTQILVNQYAILNDPKHWENPEKFMPERFIEEDGTKLKARPKSWIPFSTGQRNCIGEFVAKQNLLYTVVGILQKLSFKMAPGTEADFNPLFLWISYNCKPYQVVATVRH